MQDTMILDDHRIGKLLWKLALPATVGMMVMSLYNVVDAIFIGRGVGTDGIAGVALSFPIQMIVGAIGQMIGIGGASLLSRSLGEGNQEKANRALGNVLAASIVSGITLTLICYYFLDTMLLTFGATPTLMPFAKEYLSIVLWGIGFHSIAMALNNLVRAEGKAKIAMTTMILSAVTNIILDAIFIFGFKMGIKGAALATVIAYSMAATFLLAYYVLGKSVLKFRLRDIRFDAPIQKEILAIGVSPFVRMTAMSLLVVLLNRKLGQLGGDISIAVYGVLMRLLMLVFTPIMGIAQGLQPVAGFNYGAKNYARARESVKLAIVASTIVAVSGTLLLMVFPMAFLRMFSDDPELLAQGRDALRLILLAFPTVGFQVVGATLFQAMGKAVQTFILTLSRQILFLIPLVLILPRFLHLSGLWLSFPIADGLAAFLSLWMLHRVHNQYRPQFETLRTDI